MNFYQMDVNEIERYMRNTGQTISDPMQSLIDQLTEVNFKYQQLTEVLERWDYWTYPEMLENELELREDQLQELKDEIEAIKMVAV